MKNKIMLIVFGIISLCFFVSNVNAAFTDDYTYTLDEDNNKVLITDYKGTGTEVVVPAKASISSKNYDVVINGPLFLIDKSKESSYVKKVTISSGVKIKTAERLFYNAETIKTIIFENDIDTSELTTTKQMFYNTAGLEKLEFGNFDTSHVTDMGQMFQATGLSYLDISMLDMTNATSQESMFSSREVKKIKIGSKTKLFINSDDVKGVPFNRGAWRRESDGKEFSSLEIAMKSISEDMSGTYEYVSDISSEIVPKFPVTYKIKFKNSAEIVETSPNSHFKMIDSTDNKRKYLYYDMIKEGENFVTDPSEYVTLKLVDCVTDKDGNLYDLQIKITNFVTNQMPDKVPDNQSLESVIYLLLTSNESLLFANTMFKNSNDMKSGANNIQAANGTSSYDVDFKVINKNGTPVEGSYIFSAYDIDIPANKNHGDTNYISTITPDYGYGLHSEGVNLYSGGFDLATLQTAKTKSFLFEINDGLPEGIIKRFTGTRSDCGSEASEFVIKADSLGAKVQFTFGRNAGISVLSFYQPKIVKIDNKNELFENLIDSKFTIVDEDGNTVAEWSSKKEPDSFFLNPGKYIIKQQSVEGDYILAEDVTLVVDSNDKIIVNGTKIDGDLVTVFNKKQPAKEVVPEEQVKKCSYKKENGKMTYFDGDGNEITKDEWSNKCAEPVPTGSFLPVIGIISGVVLVLVSFLITKKSSKLKNL